MKKNTTRSRRMVAGLQPGPVVKTIPAATGGNESASPATVPVQPQAKTRIPFHQLSPEEQDRIVARRKETKPINEYNAFGIDERKFDKENYHYEIINDDPEKQGIEIQKKLDDDWELVTGDMESPDKRSGSASQLGSNVSRPVGNGVIGRLMRIPIKMWEADEKERQKVVNRTEEDMKKKKRLASNPDDNGFYSPEGVSIEHKSR